MKKLPVKGTLAAILGVALVLSVGALAAGEFGTWAAKADLTEARADHTAVMLPDGRALIVGGTDMSGNPLASAETYDPSTETFTVVSGGLATPVSRPQATGLNDGRVLIAGGIDGSNRALATAEIFDPASGNFT